MLPDEVGWRDLLRSLLGAAPRPTDSDLPELEPEALEPELGAVLGGRYHLVDRLGRGGAAVVYRARDAVLDLDVAIKVLLLDGLLVPADASDFQATLRQEARAALRLTHPNIVRVHTYESSGGFEYLVMEYVEGRDLHGYRRLFDGHRVPVRRLMPIAVALADALAYAHAQGVVHNDVKPANIMLDGDTPKLCDFGLALLADRLERNETVSGSPVYMAPERLKGSPGDQRSDQYSLAATLFTALTGRAPFGRDENEAIRGHLSSPLPVNDWVPADLDRALRRAMSKSPEQRFESVTAFSRALSTLEDTWSHQTDLAIEVDSETPAGLEDRRATANLAGVPRPRPTSKVKPARVVVASAPPPATPSPPPRAPEGMVFVSERRVTVSERPLTVGPLFAEVFPVTAAAYQRFVTATGHTPPAHWFGARPPPGREDHPVVGVSLDDARAYAAWAGRRLPTEAEWMSLLRGPDGTERFPWGDECRRGDSCHCSLTGATDTSPVGLRRAGASREGIQELLGNVWEWVEADPRLPKPPEGVGVALGASFRHRCTTPGQVPRTELGHTKSYQYLGFRCVADLPEVG